jgi:hypothetical protein
VLKAGDSNYVPRGIIHRALDADPATAQSSWWVTTSPFLTKDDSER